MDTERREKYTALVVLLCLMAAGLALRVYRISDESVDLEEYVSASHLDAPSLSAFIHEVRITDPPIAPLPFAFIYAISKITGPSVLAIRSVFVLLGLLLIPLVFLFTSDFLRAARHRSVAGLTAALCVALSPLHVFYAQEMRHTTLFTLFALGSVWFLLRATRDNRPRWWLLNTIANILLVWTHMMGVIVLLVEGLFLLLRFPPWPYRSPLEGGQPTSSPLEGGQGGCKSNWPSLLKVGLWGAVNVLLLIPYASWAWTVPVQTFGAAFSFLTKPGWLTFWTDLIADDVVNLGYPFKPNVHNALTPYHGLFDTALVIVGIAACVWGVWQMARKREPGPERAEWALLLMLFGLPTLFLLAVSYVWIPCLCTRYSIYSTLALYVLLGAMVASLRSLRLQIPAGALIAILFAYQLTQALPGPIRTDWKAVANHIEREGQPAAAILAYSPFYLPVFQFNQSTRTHPAAAALTHQGLADLVDFARKNLDGSSIWVIILKEHDPQKLEAELNSHGIAFAADPFGGERLPTLYRINAVPAPALDCPWSNVLAPMFARNLSQPPLDDLRRVIRWDPDEAAGGYVRLAFDLAAHDRVNETAACLERAIEINPAWATCLMTALAQCPDADSQLDTAIAQNLLFGYRLLVQKEYVEARDVFQAIEPEPLAILGLWRAHIALNSDEAAIKQDTHLQDLYRLFYAPGNPKYDCKAAGQSVLPELAVRRG